MEKQNFGIITNGKETSKKIIEWFCENGYNINSWSGNANDGYYYYVLEDDYVHAGPVGRKEEKLLKLYTWQEIEEMENFELPEKWCIRWGNRDNYKFINDYINNSGKSIQKNLVYERDDVHSKALVTNINSYYRAASYIPTGYTEITIEQLKKYILKQKEMKKYTIKELRNADIDILVNSDEEAAKIGKATGYNEKQNRDFKPLNPSYPIRMWITDYYTLSWDQENFKSKSTTIQFSQIDFEENRKIIGYKAPKSMFNNEVLEGTLFTLVKNVSGVKEGMWYSFGLHATTSTYSRHLPKEIVEDWEPVYEEIIKSKEIQLGTPARKFTIFKDKVEVVDGDGHKTTYNNEDVQFILDRFAVFSFKGLNSQVKSIQIGCSAGLEVSKYTIEQILKIQQNL